MAAADPTASDQPTDGILAEKNRRAEWRQHRIRTRTWSLTPIQQFTKADLRRWRSVWQVVLETASLPMVRDAATKHIHSINAQLTLIPVRSSRNCRHSPDANL